MEIIDVEHELSFYVLEGKWNDYIGMQKEVVSKLKETKFFECGEIVNIETGMRIKISPKGIKETIGKGKRFQNLPKVVKMQKIATIKRIPILLKEGKLIADEVPNYYNDKGERFAYFVSEVEMDKAVYDVRIAVKKKVGVNHFYIYHIDMQKSPELLSPSQETDNYEIQNSEQSIS